MTYSEAYKAAKDGKRVKLVLPAKLRGDSHRFVMHPLRTGEVMMHIYIEESSAALYSDIHLSAMAVDHPNPIFTNSTLISEEDLQKWEAVE